MIQQLIGDFLTKYENIMGNSRIFVVFLVALLFLYLIRTKIKYNPFVMILSPLSAVAVSVTKIIDEVKTKKKKAVLFFAIFLCAFVVMLTGNRLYSQEHIKLAENTMHIPDSYKNAMDYILSKSDNPKVLAMPEYCIYNGMYSSKFDMLYEQHMGDDVRYLSEDARNAFNELSGRKPDMMIVSEAAANYGCDYIVILAGHYWPMFPLDEYDYMLETNVDGWDIYSRKEGNNG